MFNSTPSWLSDKLTAFFGKRNWKPELVRIKNEVENIGFDFFSDEVWEYEYTSEQEELVKEVADTLYVIAEYYFYDEEPTALKFLGNLICRVKPDTATGFRELWKLTDDLVHETEGSGHIFGKEMVHEVVSIQSELFWEITNLAEDTDFSEARFYYPWNVSRDFLKVDEEKQKPFSNHFESALYVAAWVTELENMFDHLPSFKETNDSIEEYLSEHVKAFDNFDTEIELDIYDLSDYLPQDKPTNFHEYFLLALEQANGVHAWKNSNFIKDYKNKS